MDQNDDVFAEVFGVKFPVCNKDQKDRMEAAYRDAMQHSKDNPRNPGDESCMCDLIIALLEGNASKTDSIGAAITIAGVMYMEKQIVSMMADQVARMPSMGGKKETVH